MSGGAFSSLVLARPRITAGRVVFYVIGRRGVDLVGVCSDRVLTGLQKEWGPCGFHCPVQTGENRRRQSSRTARAENYSNAPRPGVG